MILARPPYNDAVYMFPHRFAHERPGKTCFLKAIPAFPIKCFSTFLSSRVLAAVKVRKVVGVSANRSESGEDE